VTFNVIVALSLPSTGALGSKPVTSALKRQKFYLSVFA